MSINYKNYADALMESVGSGKSRARSVTEILEHVKMLQCVEEYNPELLDRSGSEKLYATSTKPYHTFKRNITRKLNELVDVFQDSESPTFIKTMNASERGFGKARFYWANDESKSEALGRDSVSDKLAEARAFAYRFLDSSLKHFFPPSLIEELKSDIENSVVTNKQFNEIENKLKFWPAFVERGQPLPSENHTHWRDVFDALLKNRVFTATYQSIHNSVIPELVTLSPQRIQYINHDVKLLAYVHETKCFHHFQLGKIRNLKWAEGVQHHSIRWDKFEKYYDLEIRGADWAVQHLMRIGFGKNIKVVSNGGGTSKISGKILIPDHFSRGGPDAFDCVNFLSTFGDSLQVLKPDFIRDEFRRRSQALMSLYENDSPQSSIPILLKSAHQQTSNVVMLGAYEKRYSK